jgi:hypothetical protein
MQEAEFVLRFLTLHETWGEFAGSLSYSMDMFMLRHRDAGESALSAYASAFNTALSRCLSLWEENAFQRWDGTRWRRQVLAEMYDAQMIAAYMLSDIDYNKVALHTRELDEYTKEIFGDGEFEESVRIGTNTPARLRYRVEMIFTLLMSLT